MKLPRRFSLRVLLLFVVFFSALVGWVGLRSRQARENRERIAEVERAVAALEALGAWSIEGGRETYRERTWLEEFFDDPGSADDPAESLVITTVALDDTKIRDVDLDHLKPLTSLKHLHLRRTPITNAGLERLAGLKNLEMLILDDTHIDAGVVQLKTLPSLSYLSVAGTDVTDAELAHLGKLTHLNELDLSETHITDAGMEHLVGLKHLKSIALRNTIITKKGIDVLRRALPNCRINHPIALYKTFD